MVHNVTTRREESDRRRALRPRVRGYGVALRFLLEARARRRQRRAAAFLAAGRADKAMAILALQNDPAAAHVAVGRTDEAIRLHERKLADNQRKLGTDHPLTLQSRGMVAQAYRNAG